MLFNSYSYEILYKQFYWIYLQGDIKLLLVTVNNRLKFEIEIVHDLSCHPIEDDTVRWLETTASTVLVKWNEMNEWVILVVMPWLCAVV